jgi:hypothetical protein
LKGTVTQWFPASKEVQDTEVIKQGVGVFLLEYLVKGATITAKYYVALLNKAMVSKHLQDNSAPHSAAIKHQKLAGLHSEVLKHPAYSTDLAPHLKESSETPGLLN